MAAGVPYTYNGPAVCLLCHMLAASFQKKYHRQECEAVKFIDFGFPFTIIATICVGIADTNALV